MVTSLLLHPFGPAIVEGFRHPGWNCDNHHHQDAPPCDANLGTLVPMQRGPLGLLVPFA